jgi:hypothetical protein
MVDILFWIVFSLVLLIVIPDRWDARREIAKRQAEVRRESRRARSCGPGEAPQGNPPATRRSSVSATDA